MAARKRRPQSPTVVEPPRTVDLTKENEKAGHRKKLDKQISDEKNIDDKIKHFAPLPLMFTIMICSSFLWVLSYRDMMATGRPVAGTMDEALMVFTKSNEFYDDSRGWKSTGGGLSSIASVTTDANNMGGLFVRKLCGAAGLAVHSQKIVPLLFQPSNAHFVLGHFNPMLNVAALGNISLALLHYSYLPDLEAAGAGDLVKIIMSILVFEALVMLLYCASATISARKLIGKISVSPDGAKKARSVVNRVIMRTVGIVSGVIAVIAGRDLLCPGQIIPIIPRDDIYLEWTNAFLHSPPPNSPEAEDHSLEAPFYLGDKYVSHVMALHVLITCAFKVTSSFLIRTGFKNEGEIKANMIWKVQSIGDWLILFTFRMFTFAAKSASLDIRWHLMTIGYEAFVLGVYGFL